MTTHLNHNDVLCLVQALTNEDRQTSTRTTIELLPPCLVEPWVWAFSVKRLYQLVQDASDDGVWLASRVSQSLPMHSLSVKVQLYVDWSPFSDDSGVPLATFACTDDKPHLYVNVNHTELQATAWRTLKRGGMNVCAALYVNDEHVRCPILTWSFPYCVLPLVFSSQR